MKKLACKIIGHTHQIVTRRRGKVIATCDRCGREVTVR